MTNTKFQRLRAVVVAIAVTGTIAVGASAASLGGISSADVASFSVSGTVSVPTTTLPPRPDCGAGDNAVACVVPVGTTIDVKKLKWKADIVVLGTIDGDLEVKNGNITIGAGGLVTGKITQKGDGGVTVLAGGNVGKGIKEDGNGSVDISGTVADKVEEKGDGNLIIGPNGSVGDDAKESGPGNLVVNGTVADKAEEKDAGDLTVNGGVDEAKESGPGNLVVNGTVTKKAEENDDGDLIIGLDGVVGSAKESDAGELLCGTEFGLGACP